MLLVATILNLTKAHSSKKFSGNEEMRDATAELSGSTHRKANLEALESGIARCSNFPQLALA